MNNKRHWLVLGATALVSASLLSGCSSTGSKNTAQSLEAEPPTLAAQDQAPATQAQTQAQTQDRPGGLEGELVVITATVKAIDKKNRVVTLQSPDGKVAKVKCGPEGRC